MLLPAEVSGSSVPRSCCLFKEAGLCPEEAEKFCPPDLRFPATRRDQDLSVNLRPEASRDPLGVEPPLPEVRPRGVRGRPGTEGAWDLLSAQGRCGLAPPPKTLPLLPGQPFSRPPWAQGTPGCRVPITPAPTNCLAVH